jgi:hypothetical protein
METINDSPRHVAKQWKMPPAYETGLRRLRIEAFWCGAVPCYSDGAKRKATMGKMIPGIPKGLLVAFAAAFAQ